MARVLVVDDEKSIRTTLSEFLRADGHDTETAIDVEDALNRLLARPFDLVLTDIALPRVSGVDLLRRMHASDPHVKVVMITGDPTVESAAEAVRCGAMDYLVKPIDKEAILRSVRHALQVKTLEDIQRRLEETNRQYRDELERRVEERTQALRETNLRLEETLDELQQTQTQVIRQERLKALGEMVSGIAHDFNNVLMPIMGLPDYLLSDPALLNNPNEVASALQIIQSAARDAREIVRRLREFYRPNDPCELHAIPVERLVNRAVTLTEPAWRTQAEAQGRTITVSTQFDQSPTLIGNETALVEALTNLILNAVDAIPKDGTITLRTSLEGPVCCIRIADTGMGMSEETRTHCFEPFFSSKEARGTGLGLSVCHGIVTRHGGTIDVQSHPGHGTTFILRIPLQPPEPREPDDRAACTSGGISPNSATGLCVLVVDDEQVSRDLTRRYLTAAGYRVETVASGAQALERLRLGQIDMVVTDRAMPGMSGDELARAVKGIAPKIRVVMLTGFGDLMRHRNELPDGVDELVAKPVTPDELTDAVKHAIRRADSAADAGE